MPVNVLTQADFSPQPASEARRRFAQKAALTSELFDRLTEAAQRRAFRVAGVNNARLIQAVRNRIAAAIEDGRLWPDVRRELTRLFSATGQELPGLHRLRQVFITNTQMAYNDARREVLEKQADTFPYWQYLTVGNGTPGVNGVRDEHARLHGLIFRSDDPFWDAHYPPWGFNCRCTVAALTPGQVRGLDAPVRDLGYVRNKLGIPAQAAFDRSGEPDLSNIDADLRRALEAMIDEF
jgi:SPP1 gp7 family putative phage head morphogenesis protein